MWHLSDNVVATDYGNESEWQAARAGLITGTRAATICSSRNTSYQGRLNLWYVMAGRAKPYQTQYIDEQDMGLLSEGLHADIYAGITGRTVYDPGPYTVFTNKRFPGIGATLDRLQEDPEAGIGVGPELKWVREFRRKQFESGLPEYILYQVQTQMLVTELKWATVSVCIGGCKPLVFDVCADTRVQAGILRKSAEWFESLRNDNPPEPTGHESDAFTLDSVFGEHDEGIIECGRDLLDVYEELERISKERIAIEKREEQIKAKVKHYMGSHTRAIGAGYEFSITGKNRQLRRKKGK